MGKTYTIGEIGLNTFGSVELTKQLIDVAIECGFSAVKLQKRTLPKAVPEHQWNIPKETPWGTISYLDYKYKVEFSKEQYDEINSYCKARGIDWSVSVWDTEALEFIKQYNPPFIKIPSALLTDVNLVRSAAIWCHNNNKKLIVSLGMSDEIEIECMMMAIFEDTEVEYDDVVLMWCNSSYPATNNELNLKVISKRLKKLYPLIKNLGYSGHELELATTAATLLLDVNYLERHITLDKTMFGGDQKCSLDPVDMKELMRLVKVFEEAGGDGDTISVTESQIPIRKKLRGV